MLIAKTDGHGLVLRTHMVEGEDWVPRLSSDLELYYSCACKKIRIIIKYKKKQKEIQDGSPVGT